MTSYLFPLLCLLVLLHVWCLWALSQNKCFFLLRSTWALALTFLRVEEFGKLWEQILSQQHCVLLFSGFTGCSGPQLFSCFSSKTHFCLGLDSWIRRCKLCTVISFCFALVVCEAEPQRYNYLFSSSVFSHFTFLSSCQPLHLRMKLCDSRVLQMSAGPYLFLDQWMAQCMWCNQSLRVRAE